MLTILRHIINSKVHDKGKCNECLLWISIREHTTKMSVTSLVVSVKDGSPQLKRVERVLLWASLKRRPTTKTSETSWVVSSKLTSKFILFYRCPQRKRVERVQLWA